MVTRCGQIRWCSSSWEPMRDETGRQIGYMGTEFDITERKLAEEAMRLDTELFQAVLEVEQAVSAAGLDSETVMRVIAERSKGLTGASGAVIEAIEGEDVVPLVHVGTAAPRLKMSSSLSGICVRTGELQRCDDTLGLARPHQAYQDLGIRSILVVPLKDEHRTLGVLKVVSPEAHAFTERDAKALRLLGGLMGAALGHAAAFEGRQSRLEERTRALQESEQRFKQLVDVAQEGIWVADDRGVITYVNQRLADLLGYGNGSPSRPAGLRLHRARLPRRRPAHPGPPGIAAGTEPGPALPAARRHPALGPGVVEPDPGEGWSPGGHGRHGHRHHRAEAHRGSASPLGRPAHHAARHGSGDPRRPSRRRKSAALPWAGCAGWFRASGARWSSSISIAARPS